MHKLNFNLVSNVFFVSRFHIQLNISSLFLGIQDCQIPRKKKRLSPNKSLYQIPSKSTKNKNGI